MISSGVTQAYDVNVEQQLRPDVTGAAPAVAARMRSTKGATTGRGGRGGPDPPPPKNGRTTPTFLMKSVNTVT